MVFGALAALQVGLPTAAVLAVVAFFALFHGFAHGQEVPAAGTILAYLAGFTLATAVLHVAGTAALARVAPQARARRRHRGAGPRRGIARWDRLSVRTSSGR